VNFIRKINIISIYNYDTNPKNAILSSDVFDRDFHDMLLIRFSRDIDVKSTEDLVLFIYADRDCNYTIHSGSKFTMYEI